MSAISSIEELGYSKNEAKVYVVVLNMGEGIVTDISKRARLPRTSTQFILDKLRHSGIVSSYRKRRYKYWVAERPEKLLALLEEREKAFRLALPELNSLKPSADDRPHVKVYVNSDQVKRIHDDIIATKMEVSGIVSWDQWVGIYGSDFMNSFLKRRTQNFLRMRQLMPKSQLTISLRAKDHAVLTQTRFLPEGFSIKDTIYLYGTKVAIVSLNKKLPTAVLINDANTAATMTSLFNDLWERAR